MHEFSSDILEGHQYIKAEVNIPVGIWNQILSYKDDTFISTLECQVFVSSFYSWCWILANAKQPFLFAITENGTSKPAMKIWSESFGKTTSIDSLYGLEVALLCYCIFICICLSCDLTFKKQECNLIHEPCLLFFCSQFDICFITRLFYLLPTECKQKLSSFSLILTCFFFLLFFAGIVY